MLFISEEMTDQLLLEAAINCFFDGFALLRGKMRHFKPLCEVALIGLGNGTE